jgi:hypothetical protein
LPPQAARARAQATTDAAATTFFNLTAKPFC